MKQRTYRNEKTESLQKTVKVRFFLQKYHTIFPGNMLIWKGYEYSHDIESQIIFEKGGEKYGTGIYEISGRKIEGIDLQL